jgi:peptide deformylase
MSALRLLYWPNPLLRKKSEPVLRGEIAESQIREVFRLMTDHKGVGLSAPQVGLLKRFFVMNPTGKDPDELYVQNPVLVKTSGRQLGDEGCLSFPTIYIEVERPNRVRLQIEDRQGRSLEREFEGLSARIVLHEMDHLEGILLADRMTPGDKLRNRRLLQDLEDRHRREFHSPPKA